MKENGSSIFDDDQILDSFWGALDSNKDGTVNKKELIVGLTVLASGSVEQKLRLSFSVFDFDRNGAISADEFKTMMKAMGRLRLYNERQLEQWVNTTVQDMFKKIDKDGNGELTCDGTNNRQTFRERSHGDLGSEFSRFIGFYVLFRVYCCRARSYRPPGSPDCSCRSQLKLLNSRRSDHRFDYKMFFFSLRTTYHHNCVLCNKASAETILGSLLCELCSVLMDSLVF